MNSPNRGRSAATLLAMGLFVLATPMKAHSCGWCVNLTSFTLSHPRSIEIALATRAAIEKGVLRKETELIAAKGVLGDGNGMMALRRIPARQLVESWTKSQKFTDSGESVTVHFLFIADRETCGIEIRKGVALFQANQSERCDVRVITTKEALLAVLEGRLSLSKARALGLLVTENEGDRSLISLTD